MVTVEQVVDKLLEQDEPSFDQIDFGEEPALSPPGRHRAVVSGWTIYVVPKSGNDSFPEGGDRFTGSPSEVLDFLASYHAITRGDAMELIREIRLELPMTYGVTVFTAMSQGDIYTYAFAHGNLPVNDLLNAISEYHDL